MRERVAQLNNIFNSTPIILVVPSVIVVSVSAGVEPMVAVPTVPDVPAPAKQERTWFHNLSADKGNTVYLAPKTSPTFSEYMQ